MKAAAKRLNKAYIKAEDGLVNAIAFHDEYHKPYMLGNFDECIGYPCRLIRNTKESQGIG